MRRFSTVVLVVAGLSISAGALADASDFTLVNGTGSAMTGIAIKRTGTMAWRALSPGLSAGAKSAIAFKDPDCAFDIKAAIGGGDAAWAGVNLCEVKSVTLRRDSSGLTWVDYD